ncbi:unnamed protein product, partial [Choristocarpus tenellus]
MALQANYALLRQCVTVVLENASPHKVSSWCGWLLALGEPSATMEALRAKRGNSSSRICGYVFRRGDIAWNCRRCQMDSTCVQCDSCFRRSDHTGHPVYFHRTALGGCCDCGDEEAWAESGCCPRHRPKKGGPMGVAGGNYANPVEALPESLQ